MLQRIHNRLSQFATSLPRRRTLLRANDYGALEGKAQSGPGRSTVAIDGNDGLALSCEAHGEGEIEVDESFITIHTFQWMYPYDAPKDGDFGF